MAGRGLTELQGVTVDFWGGPHSFSSPMASEARPGPSLARMYQEQLWAAGRGL